MLHDQIHALRSGRRFVCTMGAMCMHFVHANTRVVCVFVHLLKFSGAECIHPSGERVHIDFIQRRPVSIRPRASEHARIQHVRRVSLRISRTTTMRERVFVCLFGLMIAHFLWGRCDVPQSNPFWANRKPVSLFSAPAYNDAARRRRRSLCSFAVRANECEMKISQFMWLCVLWLYSRDAETKQNTNLPTDTNGHRIPARDRVCARRRARRRVKREARRDGNDDARCDGNECYWLCGARVCISRAHKDNWMLHW